jgi:hypothetical protein
MSRLSGHVVYKINVACYTALPLYQYNNVMLPWCYLVNLSSNSTQHLDACGKGKGSASSLSNRVPDESANGKVLLRNE